MRLPINIMWVFSNIHLFIHAFTPVCQLLYTFIQSPDSCVCAQSFTHVRPFVTLWTVVHQAPLSMRLSQQEYWNGFNWCLLWRKTLGEVKLSLSLLFSSVQSLSRLQFFATPWITARQASLSITNSQSSPKLISMELVMPSNYLILCRPLLLPSIFPHIWVFSNESALCITYYSVIKRRKSYLLQQHEWTSKALFSVKQIRQRKTNTLWYQLKVHPKKTQLIEWWRRSRMVVARDWRVAEIRC